MADEVRDLLIRIRSESSGLNKGIGEANGAFDRLNLSAGKVAIGIGLVTAATAALLKAIDRGQIVSELSTAFNSLEKQAGGSATALDKLKDATGGLIDNLDLMRASNQALLSGLTPDQFLQLASAADTLGDAVGKNTKEALDDLVNSVSTGNERMLKAYGITIDNAKAEAEFAKSLGVTASQLNELGKKEAARIALIDVTQEKTKKLGAGTETAGDQMQKLGNALSNSVSYVTQWINESQNLVYVLKQVADTASNATSVIRYLFSNDAVAQNARLLDDLIAKQERVNQLNNLSPFGIAFRGGDENVNRLKLKASNELSVATFEYNANLIKLRESQTKVSESSKRNTSDFIETSKGLKELIDKTTEQKLALDQLSQSSSLSTLEKSLEKAFGTTNFQGTLTEYKNKLYETTWQSIYNANKQAIDSSSEYKIKAEQLAQAEVSEIVKDKILQDEDFRKEQFQNSVDFFADILTTSITGSAQDMEDILKDALKRVAIGFGAQMLASITGFSGNITSAQGLGQALAASAGFEGSGVSGIGSILGLNSIFGGSSSTAGAFELPTFESLNGLPAASSTGGAGFFAQAAPPIAAALALYQIDQVVEGLLGKNKNKPIGIAAQAFTTGGFGLVDDLLSGDFFGGGSKRFERENREALLDKIFQGNLSFAGVGGTKTLSASNFNLDQSGFGGQAAGLLGGLTNVLSGGDGKLKDDLTGIFANAVKEGKNFNEVLINSQALLDKTGYSAQQAKDELTQLFLDGKVSLDDFNAGLDNLNLLAQNNLVGKGSVADALGVITNELASNRVKLKGIGLAFTEMAEIGIDSFSEIHDYLSSTATPEIVAAFDQITSAGIDTFDEVANASNEQIKLIFNAFKNFAQGIGSEFDSVENTIANSTSSAANAAISNISKIRQSAEREGNRIRNALTISANISVNQSGDSNVNLNDRNA